MSSLLTRSGSMMLRTRSRVTATHILRQLLFISVYRLFDFTARAAIVGERAPLEISRNDMDSALDSVEDVFPVEAYASDEPLALRPPHTLQRMVFSSNSYSVGFAVKRRLPVFGVISALLLLVLHCMRVILNKGGGDRRLAVPGSDKRVSGDTTSSNTLEGEFCRTLESQDDPDLSSNLDTPPVNWSAGRLEFVLGTSSQERSLDDQSDSSSMHAGVAALTSEVVEFTSSAALEPGTGEEIVKLGHSASALLLRVADVSSSPSSEAENATSISVEGGDDDDVIEFLGHPSAYLLRGTDTAISIDEASPTVPRQSLGRWVWLCISSVFRFRWAWHALRCGLRSICS